MKLRLSTLLITLYTEVLCRNRTRRVQEATWALLRVATHVFESGRCSTINFLKVLKGLPGLPGH